MKVTDLLARDQLTLSFEVFPPKSSTALEEVRGAALAIARLGPSFVSVTYGAAGGASAYTLEVADSIQRETGVPVVAHLTCASATREETLRQIDRIRAAGVENVMALRGDLPEGGAVPGSFPHAADLVRALKEKGDFCIGGACYPEVHPESPDQRQDLRRLREKVEAGCDFLTTQMFFDNALLYQFLYKLREEGVRVPVIPGIMPITSARQIDRAIRLSGSFMPRRFISLVDRFGHQPLAMRQAGIAYATDQIIDLFANGIRNVHIYTMNHPEVAAAILSNLSHILGGGA